MRTKANTKPKAPRRQKTVESTSDFKERIAAMLPKPPQSSEDRPCLRPKHWHGIYPAPRMNDDPTKPTPPEDKCPKCGEAFTSEHYEDGCPRSDAKASVQHSAQPVRGLEVKPRMIEDEFRPKSTRRPGKSARTTRRASPGQLAGAPSAGAILARPAREQALGQALDLLNKVRRAILRGDPLDDLVMEIAALEDKARGD